MCVCVCVWGGWVWERESIKVFGVNSIRHWMSTSVAIAAPSQSTYTITIWCKISIHVRAIMCENRWFVTKEKKGRKEVHQMRFNGSFTDGNVEECHWNGKRVHVLLKRECDVFFRSLLKSLFSSSASSFSNANRNAWLWSFQLDLFHSGWQKKWIREKGMQCKYGVKHNRKSEQIWNYSVNLMGLRLKQPLSSKKDWIYVEHIILIK